MLAVGLLVSGSNVASADVITLGDQDFTNGTFPGGVAGFNGPSAGEPAPFDTFRGSDYGSPFSESWSFSYAPATIGSASISLGIFDHDSAAAGDQVASFSVDGVDITGLLNTAFNSSGGTQIEYNVYTVVLPASTFSVLSDGSATFSLTLSGPGLEGGAGATGSTTSGNGAGLDFSTLSYEAAAVPEPATLAIFGFGLAGIGLMRRRRAA